MEIIGRYQIIEEVGSGGMGTVYQAQDTVLDRQVALKLLSPHLGFQETFVERFLREARIVAQLEHAHIVPIYDLGTHEERPFLVMRLLRGGTLRDRMNGGLLDQHQLWQIMSQVALALDAAHVRQIIHRDIKPTNILFDEHGTAFVSDFGIAKVVDAATQLTGDNLIGTPAYMSPEHYTGPKVDGRSDQYSLAVVIFESLTGQTLFSGDTLQIMFKHVNEEVPAVHTFNPALSPELSSVLTKALAKNAEDRYKTVTAFVSALQIVSSGGIQDEALPASTNIDDDTSPEAVPVRMPSASPQELGQAYELGLQAMNRGDWLTAFEAFDHIVQADRYYRSALELRRRAKRLLQHASRPPRTLPEIVESKAALSSKPIKHSEITKPGKNNPANLPASHAASSGRSSTSGNVVPGAGGAASRSPSGLWKQTLFLGLTFLFLGSILGGFLLSRGDQLDGAIGNIPTPTLAVATNITILFAAEDAAWRLNGEERFMPADGILQMYQTNDTVTLSSASSPMKLTLSNGIELFLNKQSELEFQWLSHDNGIGLILHQGELVARAANNHLFISNPFGATARTTNGVLGVAHTQQPFRFDVDCLQGVCHIEGDLGGELILQAGQYSHVGGTGRPVESSPARYEIYTDIAPIVPTPTSTTRATNTPEPTSIPESTPTSQPTVAATMRPANTTTSTNTPTAVPPTNTLIPTMTLTTIPVQQPTTTATMSAMLLGEWVVVNMAGGLSGPSSDSGVWYGSYKYITLGEEHTGSILQVNVQSGANQLRIELWGGTIQPDNHYWWVNHFQEAVSNGTGDNPQLEQNPRLVWEIKPGTYTLFFAGYSWDGQITDYRISYKIDLTN